MNARPIRVLVGKPGLDGHDVGAKVVCRALRDAGMEVIYTGLRRSAEEIVATAVQEDVDVLGLSILSGAHLPLCRQVASALAARGLSGEFLWIVGGNVPRRDFAALEALGVARVFPTGSDFGDVAGFIEQRVGR